MFTALPIASNNPKQCISYDSCSMNMQKQNKRQFRVLITFSQEKFKILKTIHFTTKTVCNRIKFTSRQKSMKITKIEKNQQNPLKLTKTDKKRPKTEKFEKNE